MNEHVSYSELLCAFLDNELDGVEMSGLFYALAQSSELQNELRQLIALRAAMTGSLLDPPKHLQGKVLVATGLVARPSDVAAPTGAAAARSFGAAVITGRLFQVVLAGAVVSLVTFLMRPDAAQPPAAASAALLSNNTVSNNAAPHAIAPANAAPASMAPAQEPAVVPPASASTPAVVSTHAGEGRSVLGMTRRPASRHATQTVVPAETQVEHRTDAASTVPSTVPPASDVALQSTAPRQVPVVHDAPARDASALHNGAALGRAPIASVEDAADRTRHFRFSMRGFQARSNPAPDISPLAAPAFNNLALGLFYDIGPHDAVGLETGQEPLLQVYNGTEKGRPIRIEQNYLTEWIGAAYQYSLGPSDVLGGVEPFARVIGGAAPTGPMGRVMLGARYSTGPFSVLIGAEGSGFAYRHEGSWYSTTKLGFTYGLAFSF